MFSWFQWGVWAAGAVLEILILFRLLFSGSYRMFPFLTGYFSWQVIRIPTFLAYRWLPPRRYGDIYWLGALVAWALIFLVILELYDHSLREYLGVRRMGRTFVSSAGLVMMLAVCGSILAGSIVEADPRQWLNAWLFLMQRSIRLVHAGLLLGLALFLGWFQIRVSPLLRYLVLIWLADGAIDVVSAALRYRFGLPVYPVMAIATPLAFLAILASWYWALAESPVAEPSPWPDRRLTPDQAGLLLQRLQLIEATLGKVYR